MSEEIKNIAAADFENKFTEDGAFDFEQTFAHERLFDFTPKGKDFEYLTLEQAQEKYGKQPIIIRALYTSYSQEIKKETCTLCTDSEYINLPTFKVAEVKSILANPYAIDAINKGKCGVEIYSYLHPTYRKEFLSIRWVNIKRNS